MDYQAEITHAQSELAALETEQRQLGQMINSSAVLSDGRRRQEIRLRLEDLVYLVPAARINVLKARIAEQNHFSSEATIAHHAMTPAVDEAFRAMHEAKEVARNAELAFNQTRGESQRFLLTSESHRSQARQFGDEITRIEYETRQPSNPVADFRR